MEVKWSGWIVLAIVFYGIALAASWQVSAAVWRKDRSWKIIAPVATFLATAGMFNWVTYGMSSMPDSAIPAIQATEVAEQVFGLKSDQEYPLMASSLVGGADIRISDTRTSINVDESSSSKLSLGFKSVDGSYYIVNIPTGPVKFVVNEDRSKASVAMHLENPKNSEYDTDYGRKEVAEGPCTTGLQSGYLVCNRVREFTAVIPQWAKDAGLQSVVDKSFQHAVITLPCADYTALMEAKIILPVKGCG